MLQHFGVTVVWVLYTVAMVLAFTLPTTHRSFLIVACIAAVADRIGHRLKHPEMGPRLFDMTILWMMAVSVITAMHPLAYSWQLAALLAIQACWDLSWHAVSYHREDGVPTQPMDRDWIRGMLLCATVLILLAPNVWGEWRGTL